MLIRFLFRKLRYALMRTHTDEAAAPAQPTPPPLCGCHLNENVNRITEALGNGMDIKEHFFQFGADDRYSAALLYIDGLVDSKQITDTILRPMLKPDVWREGGEPHTVQSLRKGVLWSADVKEEREIDRLINACLSGDTVLLIDGLETALVISTRGWEKRSVTEPHSESVTRGPREGFTENLRTNMSLLRRRIRSPELRIHHMVVGERTRTSVCIAYIQGIASDEVVEQIRYRLDHLKVDVILDTGYIEEFIEDAPFSIFPTINYSEKPDSVAARMLEGRVAIIADGSPFVLTAPMLFTESFQTAEDYYLRQSYASLLRFLRFIAYLIALFLPAIFIALSSFHQELLPTRLLFTIASAREGTPFPVLVEALLMAFSFEVLREAGVRLPRYVGQSISIVGALVMGDAAVSAGLVGAPMVIIIAFTAVCSYVVPEHNDSASILRPILMVIASILGGFGLILSFWGIIIHLATLQSFGVPYYEGLTLSTDQKDNLVRVPMWMMVKRPHDIAQGDKKRMRFFIPPMRPYRQDPDQEQED